MVKAPFMLEGLIKVKAVKNQGEGEHEEGGAKEPKSRERHRKCGGALVGKARGCGGQ